MRLRIVHQLSLLLMGAVILSLAAVGGVVYWNLRSGFSEYLQIRDDAQLDRFVQLVESRAAADPSMDWLRGSRASMEALGDEFSSREGLGRRPPRPGGPRPPLPPDARQHEGAAPADGPPLRGGPPPPAPGAERPPRPAPEGIMGRVQIFDIDGQWLAGRQQPANRASVTRAVKVEGREVAWIKLTREPQLGEVDRRFLQRQTLGLLAVALGTLLVMLVLAAWVARRWSQPLRSLQQVTQRLTGGERGVQVQPAGAREIAGLMEDVNSLSNTLARLDKARRVWIAQIAHELRTPLAVLQGELEAIEDGARQPTPEVIASLHDEVMQLTRLVSDLHTLSVADLGHLHCDFTPGDGNAALLRLAQRYQARAQQQGLVLDVAPAQAFTAQWDFGRLEQLISNLLENSLRYTHAPGRISIGWKCQHELAIIRVEDTPPGVSAADLPQLFEPLFRADAARGRSGQLRQAGQGSGSGLGLAIAQAIVKAHRGQIQVSASALGGLAVEVQLPLNPAPDSTVTKHPL